MRSPPLVLASSAATVYLVHMDSPHNGEPFYCDIGGPRFDGTTCVELDLLEANTHAVHNAFHSETGRGPDGTCNIQGCGEYFGCEPESLAAAC